MREHTAEHIMAPMGPESVILVDELILHNEKAPGRATQVDMVTMSALAGSERQWEELSEKVGLRVLGVWSYVEETGDSVVIELLNFFFIS